MAIQKTFLAIKPQAVQRSETLEVLSMLKDLLPEAKCVGMNFYTPSEDLAKDHYAALSDKPFFPDLIASFTAGPILGMAWEGENVIAKAREVMGATNPADADEGTIRKKFGKGIDDNAIHGSDTEPGSADRELKIHFAEGNFAEIADPVAKAKELIESAQVSG